MALSEAPHGVNLKVTAITAEEKMKRHLMNLGIMPGATIVSLYGSGGDIIVQIKNGKIALGKTLSADIFVE